MILCLSWLGDGMAVPFGSTGAVRSCSPKTSLNAFAMLRCWTREQWSSNDRIRGYLQAHTLTGHVFTSRNLILPQDLTSRPVSNCAKLSIETVSRFVFRCCSSLLMYFFHMFLSGLSRLVNLKNYNYTGLGDLSNLFGGVTSVRLLFWPELCRLKRSSTF